MWETGKTRGDAAEDFDKLQKGLHFFPIEMKNLAGEIIPDADGNAEHKITYSPIGPVAAYLAWNFPLLNLGYKIGPTLAAGCSLIVKPSVRTPLTALMVAEISKSIGFPSGVFNVVPGDNSGFGNGLTRHPGVSGITMIGSLSSAQKIISESSQSIKRLSLELGGNAPFIVLDDANLEAAADLLVTMKTANAGQVCVSPNRVLVQEAVHDTFVELVRERLTKLKMGFAVTDSEVGLGPMIAESEAQRVQQIIDDSVKSGAVVVFGGTSDLGGAYLKPHLLVGLTPENPIFSEEIFGPVIPVYKVGDDDSVMDIANQTDTGLASYVYTESQERAARFSRTLEFGEVMINGAKWDIYLPHIGIKNSGIGMDCSKFALHDYLFMKRVTLVHTTFS